MSGDGSGRMADPLALRGRVRPGGPGTGRLSGVTRRRCIRGVYNGPIVDVFVRGGVDVSVPAVIVIDSGIIRGCIVICGPIVRVIVDRRIYGAYAGEGLDMRRCRPGGG